MIHHSPQPVGVLIPTRNSMSLLPGHLETVGKWIDLAEEIVVVDSDSDDGTAEFLRAKLPTDRTRFFNHPRGLYPSWNFGLRQIRAPYTYISTIGDGISREGFVHLAEVAERLLADVVISPPDFVDESGQALKSKPWPVHHLISWLDLQQPKSLEGIVPFLIALTFLPFAILGNSASNLYRTRVLQENPFPTDFGLNGDGAWGLVNALNIRLAITPRRMSFFRKHFKWYPPNEYRPANADERILDAGLAALSRVLALHPELEAEAAQLGVDRFIAAKKLANGWRAEFIRQRIHPALWVFNPFAWHARFRRGIAQRRCDEMLKTVLAASAVTLSRSR